MKILLTALLLLSLVGNSNANGEVEYVQTDKLQILNLQGDKDKFEIAVDFRSSGFLQALLKIDLDNVVGVNITDVNLENKICKYSDKNWQVFFVRNLDKDHFVGKRLHIRIKFPCVVSNESKTEHKALLKVKVITSDNKHFENTVTLKIIGHERDIM